MSQQYYCPSCDCQITYSDSIQASLSGCYQIGDNDGFGLEGDIGAGNASGTKAGGNPNAAVGVTGGSPIGFNLPFGLGLNSFLSDILTFICEKLLPDGFCKIAKIVLMIILVLIALAAIMFVKNLISRK